MLARFSLRLQGGRVAPSEARRYLRRFHDDLEPEVARVVSLLVSEVVTNAVTHGGGGERVFVDADVSRSVVRVEVEDTGPGFTPPAAGPVPSNGSGFGLYLVDVMADRWAVETTSRGTRVWFELDR